uniref:NADH dehydrogenase subunit 3 n=1 Tax=Sinocentrus brevicornis TaxID=3038129 RepID=UPI002551E2A8|nr:NADH dehydrogenase subunit 3 [Sinocentrus brevicornis]WFD60959.1 NADH dehydrogenase subunit 3 [Sinocentrus brevicornis]
MMLMIKYMITIMVLLTLMTLLLTMMSKKSINDMQKMSPFECGFNPLSNKRMPFSIHFFMIAIIFLIFDVEIVIIMPMVTTMKFTMIKYWSMTSILFIMILILGLYYEWYNGLLNWTK